MSHVFNFDAPWHPDDYVHRIGRTGRGGATGIAYTLVAPDDAENIENIEKLTGQKIERREVALADEPKPERARRARPTADEPQAEERAPERARDRSADRSAGQERGRERERSRDAGEYRRRRDPVDHDRDVSVPGEWNGPVPAFLSVSLGS